jgi:hypothetical protein
MIISHKHKKFIQIALQKDTFFMALEGPAQTGKTNAAILAFGLRVAESDGQLHCISGKTLDSIRDNIIQGENKFLELFKGLSVVKRDFIGGRYIQFNTKRGPKKILLATYDNISSWTKILGKPIECFLVDEINIAHPDFVKEIFARQMSFTNPFAVCTLNGDDPDHYVYKDYINYCKDIFPHDTPASTTDYLREVENKPGYHFAFWSHDDHPTMTPEKKQRIFNIYPEGSYYYMTKVLGIRGVQDGLLYGHLIDSSLMVRWDDLDPEAFTQLEIGIDIGDKAATVFCLTGYTKNYSRAVVIDVLSFNEADYDEIIQRFNQWVITWYNMFRNRINSVWPDAADSIFVRTLRKRIEIPSIVRPSKKATIKERVILKEQLLHQKRLLFVQDFGGEDMAYYLKKMKTDGKGGHLDESKKENDYNDALDYSLTPHLKKMADYAKDVKYGNV